MNKTRSRLVGSCLAIVALKNVTFAQAPDVVIRMDVNPHFRVNAAGDSNFRWYDPLGKHSTVGLSMILEPGFRVLVTERLQKMPSDSDQLDEYYIEDEGNWRVGKQYMPFGRQTILNESVQGGRIDTNLIIEGLPISLGACDGGPGRQKGVIGRIGTTVGLSFAFGDHFGIDGTSLGVVRDPDEAPGKGRGYEQVVGLDFFRRLGQWRFQTEWVAFRGGETAADEDTEVSDVSFTYVQSPDATLTAAWSRDWRGHRDIYRIQGHVLLTRSVWLEPLLRFQGSSFKDFGVSVRAKL